MQSEMKENKLLIRIDSRIDSNNATAIESEINSIREAADYTGVILDLEHTEYLSSAGLRVILRLKKADKDLQIINASSEVYEILDMTGFTEMMPVSKAYRQFSVDGCEVIGEGSNGIVYRYTDDIIVKVYKNNDALEDIHRERELARTALVLGVNTAIPYDVVKVGDKYGSVFELLSAQSLSRLILADPDHMDKYIEIFTDMLKDIHGTQVKHGTLPSIKDTYLAYAEFMKDHLDAEHADKLKKLIEAVPESDYMIHGDYHTNNVHYAGGEAILIDMDTLAVGDPIFEFASTFLAYVGFNELDPESSLGFLKIDAKQCLYIYNKLMELYFAHLDADAAAKKDAAIRILGYTRLLRRTIRRYPDQTDNIAFLKGRLEKLIEQTDRLV